MGFVPVEDYLKLPRRPLPDRWGRWVLDRETHVLRCDEHDYEVDLDECRNSAEVLDWIAQVRAKAWITAEDLGNLVQALDDVLRLQQNYCGGGEDHTVDPAKLLS